MLQNLGDGDRAGIDDDIDVERTYQCAVSGLVDKRNGARRPGPLGKQRGENVCLVVIGQRDRQVRILEISFFHKLFGKRIALQHGGSPQCIGQFRGLRAVAFDQPQAHMREFRFYQARQPVADIATPDDDRAVGLFFLVAERRHRPRHMGVVHDEIDFVADQHLVARLGNEVPLRAHDADDIDVQIREQRRQLAQRRVDDRAGVFEADPDEPDPPVRERQHFGGARPGQPPHDRAGDLALGRDDRVYRHPLARKHVGPVPVEIGRAADSGDLGRNVEQGMRNLARDHVDLIDERDGDQHVRVFRPRPGQHVGTGSVAGDCPDIQGLGQLFDQFRRLVHDRNVIVLRRQVAGDIHADLPGAADDHTHGRGITAAGRARRRARRWKP